MDYGILIAALKAKQCLTDREKDILDTWNEIQKIPFDRVSAQGQVIQNALKYPELLAVIIAVYFSTQGTVDICHLAVTGRRLFRKHFQIGLHTR